MAIHRYAVIDADGVKLNTITADEDLIKTDWYPGYGAALVDEGENPPDLPKPDPVIRPDTWGVLAIKLSEPLLVGDQVDLKTGIVTPRPMPKDEIIDVGAVEAVTP